MEYQPGNVAPRILSRAEHIISRKNIDPDALKVLYRLRNNGFVAYLVGGGVRDLLLERRPKDFDISTSAHPAQVKKLFRNCFVVGRRFRLCHVRFGRKVIEVSTFRSQAEPEEGDTLIRRDNTFGTPEQDAFRRDFTVNALFYDIATFSVIDWVGGLQDLRQRVISAIGDPGVRLREDPVRMLRAVALAARLGFTIDRDCEEAIRALRGEIVRSSPARILEEIFKILRQGRARETFLELHRHGLLAYLLPEAARALEGEGGPLLESLARLDAYRAAGAPGRGPHECPSARHAPRAPRRALAARARSGGAAPSRGGSRPRREPVDVAAEAEALGEAEADPETEAAPPRRARPSALPFPRRDLDRLRVILLAQRRLPEIRTSPAVKHVLGGRPYLDEALRWLEIHGGPGGAELAAHWRGLDLSDVVPEPVAPRGRQAPVTRPADSAASLEGAGGRPRRRRRRRGRRRPGPTPTPPV